MVKEEDELEFCAIMNLAHFYTWNFFHEQFGVEEFPWGRAFFADINSRHCICKEANESTYTISNPVDEPLGKSYTIKDLKELGAFKKLASRLK